MTMNKHCEILDTTLRDGAQGEGITFSVDDKIKIAYALDDLGVAYIEAGNPGSNPKDLEFFERMKGRTLRHAKLCAFGSTHRKDIVVEEDANVLSLLAAGTDCVAIFGKTWDLHVTGILKATLAENLDMIRTTVAFFKSKGKEVIFDAEHFFDGCKNNKTYAFEALRAAVDGGADVLCLCDTNGGCYPTDLYELTKKVAEKFDGVRIGVHCHNDAGMAVACSMLAVDAGATHVQGTFVGFGERCGNANLSTIIPNLQLKRGYSCILDDKIGDVTQTARFIADIANQILPNSLPYVGNSAFAHKGGMHIDGVSKISRSFEHIDPEQVGNERRFLMSEVSGRASVLAKINRIAPHLTKDSPEIKAICDKLKELEHQGYQFEAAEQSFELLIKKELGMHKPFFTLHHLKIISEHPPLQDDSPSTATVSIDVDGETEITASMGDGPVNALDAALRKVLIRFYPSLARVRLTDYKVRVLEPQAATAAKVRVLIESSDGECIWTTVGVSTDIIQASWLALVDSIDYKLSKDKAEGRMMAQDVPYDTPAQYRSAPTKG